MISLEEAQKRLLRDVQPLEQIDIPLSDARGRFLAADITAKLTHPPNAVSSMDGYAIRFADLAGPWRVVGESAAGDGAKTAIEPGEAIRIFTGATMPAGADTVLIQEEARQSADRLELTGEGPPHVGANVRPAGLDFYAGSTLARAGTRITPALIGLFASAGHATLPVYRRPRVALLATGNELVAPGDKLPPGQITNANGVMLRAMFEAAGAEVEDLGIVRDDLAALTKAITRASSYDILITAGGASFGDHDLVRPALEAAGAQIDFWRVAIRPGKPVIAGALGNCRVLGLPGNPVSAFVCAVLFGLPLVRRLSGASAPLPKTASAMLGTPLPANGVRQDYIRATATGGSVTPASAQDSSMLSILAASNALIVRPPHAQPAAAGEQVVIIPLDSDSFGS